MTLWKNREYNVSGVVSTFNQRSSHSINSIHHRSQGYISFYPSSSDESITEDALSFPWNPLAAISSIQIPWVSDVEIPDGPSSSVDPGDNQLFASIYDVNASFPKGEDLEHFFYLRREGAKARRRSPRGQSLFFARLFEDGQTYAKMAAKIQEQVYAYYTKTGRRPKLSSNLVQVVRYKSPQELRDRCYLYPNDCD